jgi:hypothetical protein
LIGGQVLDNASSKESSAQVQLSVDHLFRRSGRLGYWIFVYNAKLNAAGAPSVNVQTRILRDGQTVLAAPQRTVNNGAPDPNRIAFGQDVNLQTLLPGRYDLVVTVTDTIAGVTATQNTPFRVQ